MVMEFFPKGTLRDLISIQKKRKEKVSPENAFLITLQLLLGLYSIHSNHLVHKDLKPENIFIAENLSAKIGDFGTAECVKDEEKGLDYVGDYTQQYVSPERIEGMPYSYAADVWSLGVCLYELCALEHPFFSPNIARLLFNVSTKEPFPIEGTFYPEDFKLIILSMLKKDSLQRPTVAEILRNPFLVEFARHNDFLKYFPPKSSST